MDCSRYPSAATLLRCFKSILALLEASLDKKDREGIEFQVH